MFHPDFSWSTWYLASEWIIRLAMLPIVVQRRRSSAAMAWLLVIFFLPWFGLFVYWLIGENRLPLKRIREHAQVAAKVRALGLLAGEDRHVVHPELAPEQAPLVALAERLGDMPIVGGNHVELITDTVAAVDNLIADIDAATHHVHLMFYIYAADATGERVAAALARAVKRGVKCRVLADAVGSRPLFKRLGPQMREQGIELHSMLAVNLVRMWFARIDLRNHRKLAVIDGRLAYTGSQNIVDATYGHKNLVWHDMLLKLSGPVVLQLQRVFLEDWYAETDQVLDEGALFPAPQIVGEVAAQTLPSGPTFPTENYQRLVVAAIYGAQRHVIITSPYLVPDEALLQALECAVLRGVKVELIVPKRCNQVLVAAAGRAYYERLLRMGVLLHLHTDGLLHSKTMSVDDSLALVGSGNFDIRSFYLNFEVNMLGYGPLAAAGLRAAQEQYLAQSEPLALADWLRRRRVARLFDNVAKLLSPLL
ncbi:MAG: cardiolipin synthase [Planctomycetia bacterium]|nr:cardiolipin synthase [Planctomycetia bacterium]